MTLLHDTAHAKINLYLHVTGRRPDGYHLLDSLAVFAGACDTLRIENEASQMSLTIEGQFGRGLAAETDNLVLRAARAIQKKAGSNKNYHILLQKNLPIASGIGGGSADAACTLRLFAKLWNISTDSLLPIAETLGADVPVCIHQQETRMEGIGEHLTPAPAMPPGGLLLVNPGVGVSTPEIFRSYASLEKTAEHPILAQPRQWDNMQILVEYLKQTRNDLQKSAILHTPVINDVLSAIRTQNNCLLARMSGSGATCFGLFPTSEAAKQAQYSLQSHAISQGWWVWSGEFHQIF